MSIASCYNIFSIIPCKGIIISRYLDTKITRHHTWIHRQSQSLVANSASVVLKFGDKIFQGGKTLVWRGGNF